MDHLVSSVCGNIILKEYQVLETFEAIRRFLETAGPVLWLIGVTAMLLGAMIIERK